MSRDRGVPRRALPEDLDDLLVLEEVFPGNRLSRRAFLYHIRNPRAVFLVMETQAGLSGYALALRRADSPWWRLYSIARAGGAPHGTGRVLLQTVIGAARAHGAAGIRLEVREDNTQAIRLYRALGFGLCGSIDGYYEDGARALRMALAFHG